MPLLFCTFKCTFLIKLSCYDCLVDNPSGHELFSNIHWFILYIDLTFQWYQKGKDMGCTMLMNYLLT